MTDTHESVLWRQDGRVATIALNRPHKLNAVTPEMTRTLLDLAARINADDGIRAVVLTGAGERAFSAGTDITTLDQWGTNWQIRNRADYCRALWGVRKPMVAAVRGYAIGGGLELALACDIRIASPTARFGAGEVKLGWLGGAGATQLLPRLVGSGNALRMLLTGDLIDAAEAHRIGLVQEVVPDETLESAAGELAERIAQNAPLAAQLIKHLVRVAESTSLDVGLQYENDMFAYCFTTKDHEEGMAAFGEKRTPNFRGE